ncbi:hypothetical protein KKF34_17980 [Myxococcota bacterium]|nr:hypothetical protein [Myxococcota bacterium]MBU1379889.1 hypothetical protein [Myxococcota bacterium]MBU1498774.1 hypothetical protein [Myxococcota bacterium]
MSTITRAIVNAEINDDLALAVATLIGKSVSVYCNGTTADEFLRRKMKVEKLADGQSAAILRSHLTEVFDEETKLLLLICPLPDTDDFMGKRVLETETLIRFGARNFDRVVTITDLGDLKGLISDILADNIHVRKRQTLAAGAFRVLQEHDAKTADFIDDLLREKKIAPPDSELKPEPLVPSNEIDVPDQPEEKGNSQSNHDSQVVESTPLAPSNPSIDPAATAATIMATSDSIMGMSAHHKKPAGLHDRSTSLLDIDASLALDEDGMSNYRRETGDVLFPDALSREKPAPEDDLEVPWTADEPLEENDESKSDIPVIEKKAQSVTKNPSNSFPEPDFSVVSHKKQYIIIGIFVFLIAASVIWWFGIRKKPDDSMETGKKENVTEVKNTTATMAAPQKIGKVVNKKTIDPNMPVKSSDAGKPTENRLVLKAIEDHKDDTIENAGCPQCVRDGIEALGKSKVEEAIKMFAYSISKKKNDPLTMSWLSLAYHAANRDKEAIATADEALKYDNKSRLALLVGGSTMQLMGKNKEAVPYFDRFLETADKKDTFYNDIRRIRRRLTP